MAAKTQTKPSWFACSQPSRERAREQGRGSVFPQTLLLPLDPEVAGTAEGLVDAGRDAGAVHPPLHAASQLLLVSCLAGIPAPDQVRAVVAAAESCVTREIL
jgi:hypothetical protein